MFSKSKLKIFFSFDATLWLVLAFSLIIGYLKIIPAEPKHLILVIVAYGATVPIVIDAIRALINKKISIYLLAGIALVASLIAKQWNSVIFISLMITSARIFGDYTEDKSRAAIESLLELKPQKARVEKNGKIVEVPVEELKEGDIVVVELGEKIPVDGIVEKGEAEINQSALTGESLPISKKPGDQVLSSGIVESGNLTIKTVKIGKETTFEKFIALVEQSQKNKAGIMRLSDKFAAWYIILTIIASSAIYVFTHNVYLVLGVLLVSCADDVAVALPLAFLTSMGHAAKHGAIIKGANYLEALSKVKVVVMDKTGTLTKGRLKVENIFSFGGAKPKEVAEAAAIVSVMSDHPSSQAITRYAKEKNISANEPEKFNEYAGKGAIANYKNQKITSGKIAFFEELKIKIAGKELEAINREKDKGLGINLIARDDKMLGFLTFADEIRPKVKTIITELENLGVEKIVMLTGDNEKIAKRVANQVGIKYYHANLLPEDKLRYIKSYLSENYKTAMIGDGVNDAAALALADVGIAMGAIGSDAAIEAADIALMRDEINQVPELIRIGKSTMKIVRQDLLIWGCVNVLGFILVFGRIFGPDGAAAYNFITDFFPLINSLRLFM